MLKNKSYIQSSLLMFALLGSFAVNAMTLEERLLQTEGKVSALELLSRGNSEEIKQLNDGQKMVTPEGVAVLNVLGTVYGTCNKENGTIGAMRGGGEALQMLANKTVVGKINSAIAIRYYAVKDWALGAEDSNAENSDSEKAEKTYLRHILDGAKTGSKYVLGGVEKHIAPHVVASTLGTVSDYYSGAQRVKVEYEDEGEEKAKKKVNVGESLVESFGINYAANFVVSECSEVVNWLLPESSLNQKDSVLIGQVEVSVAKEFIRNMRAARSAQAGA